MGLNSGRSDCTTEPGWRNSPSPRSSERMPVIQPRHESWAMITVTSETTAASPMKR